MFSQGNLLRNVDMDVNDIFKLKKAKYFTKKEKEHRFENKGICGIILNCTSPSTATKAVSNYNSNKKARTAFQPAKSYHRWFLCADAMNPPHTFVLLTHTHQQTCELLENAHDDTFMGMPFYLVEPNLSTSRVGDYLPIIEHKGKLWPLKTRADILRKPAILELPSKNDHTYYFVLEDQNLKLTRMKYSFGTCTGYQCDRHWGKDGCVCCFGSKGNSLVYMFDFQLDVDEKQFETGKHVASLNSFKLMSVFFHDLVEYTGETTGKREAKHLQRRRSQIRRLIAYINNHGGWKIIGWCKRGLLSVEGETEKVESQDVNLRLTSIYPQNEEVLKDPVFRALRIRQDWDLFDNQLPNLFSGSSSDSDSSSDSSDSDDDDSNNINDTASEDDDGNENYTHTKNDEGYDYTDDDDEDNLSDDEEASEIVAYLDPDATESENEAQNDDDEEEQEEEWEIRYDEDGDEIITEPTYGHWDQ